MGVASLVLSIVGAVIALVGFIPFLGILNWFAVALLFIGLVLGILGTVLHKKKGAPIAGLVISVLFLVLAVIRLIAGRGIL
jgi:hypothetical protein